MTDRNVVRGKVSPRASVRGEVSTRAGVKANSISRGLPGRDGLSAYEIAVANGYRGTEKEWLDSLNSADPELINKSVAEYLDKNPIDIPVVSVNGKTGEVKLDADDIGAVDKNDLQSVVNGALKQAKESGEFDGLDGKDGKDGYTPQKDKDYFDGKDGASVTVKKVVESTADGGSNVVTFSDGKTVTIKNGKKGGDGYTPQKDKDYFDGKDGKSAYELAVKNGFKGTEAEWLISLNAVVDPEDVRDAVDEYFEDNPISVDPPNMDDYLKKEDAEKEYQPKGSYLTETAAQEWADNNYQPKGDYLTEYQPLKTINGQSLVGYGNIVIEGGSSNNEEDNSEYVELAYVENTGTQNINTGYLIQKDDVLTFEYEIPESARSVTGDKSLFMGYNGNTSIVKVGTYSDNYKFYVRFGSTTSQTTDAIDPEAFMSGVMSLSKESFSVNGVHILTPTVSSLTNATLYVPAKVSYVRVKSFKVHRNGELIKWYVPMLRRADEIPGLYEKIEGVFLTNTGSGMFVYPPPATSGGNSGAVAYVGTPSLTSGQKKAIKDLMDEWYTNRDTFFYEYYHSRNEHATTACWNSDKQKFRLCCATFVQNIMMGRSVSDYVGKTASNYSPNITKTDVSSFGYYFDFRYRKLFYGKTKKDGDGKTTGYYGFTRVNKDSDVGSYSLNTYYGEGNSALYGQQFNGLNNANDMARELYELGCEIKFSELDVGDIWFTGDKHLEPNISGYNAAAWRNITHVGMVYDVRYVDGKKVLEWIECTNAFGDDIAIEKNKLTDADDFYKFMAYRVLANHVFCARLPIAFGISPNVPSKISITPTPT